MASHGMDSISSSFLRRELVARVRELLGPTDSRKAAPGTIRGDLGTDTMRNIAHASDSVENAEVEVRRFFRPDEIPT